MLLSDEAQVRTWLHDDLGASREAIARLDAYAALLRAANEDQNLIARSTAGADLWVRHLADSAQLLGLVDKVAGPWLDLGSGPGLPGLVIAILDPGRLVVLVELRRLRCVFLEQCIATLALNNVSVCAQPLARVPTQRFSVISARAFAPLPDLLREAARFAGPQTRWLLPKGRMAAKELSTVAPAWQKLFHVKQSLTDANAGILVGTGRV